MPAGSSHRLHAVRLALVATALVLLVYLVAAVALNAFVVHRLIGQADARLSDRLIDASQPTFNVPASSPQPPLDQDHDVDDAPTFVWKVSRSGSSASITAGAPALPVHQWSAGTTTANVGPVTFRFKSVPTPSGWLVAGESVGQVGRVQRTLLAAELVFGAVLLAVVFGGSVFIGLRASAPLEVIRRRQEEFTADASHELRTPLTVIDAEIGLALSRPRDAEEYRETLYRIVGETQRLEHIVDELLWLARFEDGRRSGDRDTADVSEILLSCASRFHSVAAARNTILKVTDEAGQMGKIQADPDWIDRLIGVLVDNACKYAGAGGVVHARLLLRGNRVKLIVEDSGPGISPDQRELVFDRFHRGTDEWSGSGLGLSIAASVVRATDGSLVIDRSSLGGARLEVTWRALSTVQPPLERADGSENSGSTAVGSSRTSQHD
jgi:two-component system sensor histidine kinase CiaH